MKTRINVTAYRIRQGYPLNCYDCPVALAISGVLRKGCFARVACRIEIREEDAGKMVIDRRIPRSVARFMNAFDRRGARAVRPFSFVLDIPARLLKAG